MNEQARIAELEAQLREAAASEKSGTSLEIQEKAIRLCKSSWRMEIQPVLKEMFDGDIDPEFEREFKQIHFNQKVAVLERAQETRARAEENQMAY
jgi:hypothetical protein